MSPTVTCSALQCNTCYFFTQPNATVWEQSLWITSKTERNHTAQGISHNLSDSRIAMQLNPSFKWSWETDRLTLCVSGATWNILRWKLWACWRGAGLCGVLELCLELWVWRDAIVWVSKSFDMKLLSCCLVEGWLCVGSFYPHPCHQPLIEHHHEEDGDSVFVNVFVFVFDSVLLRMVTFTLYSTKTTLKFCCKVLLHTCVNNLYNFLAIVS